MFTAAGKPAARSATISAEQRRLEPERWELLRDDELAGDDSLEDLGYTVDLATATQA